MIELLIVIAIIALSVSLVAMALPDGDASRLEEEGARFSALLEMARAEARVSGAAVRWVPASVQANAADDGNAQPHQFRFVGLPPALGLPTHWLDRRVTVQVVGGTTLLLGPEAILPPQSVVLSLGQRRLELASDGLGPFTATVPADPAVQ
jgi:general secretion pathway protein H